MTTNAPPGRPKKAIGEQRSERLSGLRLTSAERAFVEEQAAIAGLSLAEFARRAVLHSRVVPARTSAATAALVELNRVGVNLNQIAHRLNASGKAPRSLELVLSEVHRAIEALAVEPE